MRQPSEFSMTYHSQCREISDLSAQSTGALAGIPFRSNLFPHTMEACFLLDNIRVRLTDPIRSEPLETKYWGFGCLNRVASIQPKSRCVISLVFRKNLRCLHRAPGGDLTEHIYVLYIQVFCCIVFALTPQRNCLRHLQQVELNSGEPQSEM